MLAYATMGVADMERAKAFYDELLAEMGGKLLMDMGRLAAYGTEQGGAMLSICVPYDEQAAAPGNGNMLSIAAGSKETADKLYAKAIELGATDEGAPGQRMDFFYGAYCRDLDGNKLCFCHMG